MLARALRIVVLIELFAAAAIAARLHLADDWGLIASIVAGVAAPIAVHAAIVAIDFAIARYAASPVPAQFRIGVAGSVVLYLREFADSFRAFQVALPWFAGRPLPGEQARGWAPGSPLPVLLIHGYACNRQVWRPLARWLAARGHPVDAIDLEPLFASIDDYAPLIEQAVQHAMLRTGAPRIALVCHSMGGLAARAWLRAGGAGAVARVAAIVTLGTPHRGTFHARFGQGKNARQMRIDSDWLRTLAASESASTRRLFTVILSHHDNIVAPQAVQTLPDAHVIELAGVGHLTLAYDRHAWGLVAQALGGRPAG